MTKLSTIAFVCVAAIACGGDDEVLPDAGGNIADAAADVDADPGQPDAAPTSIAYALGTDFDTGSIFSAIAVPSLEVTQNVVAGVASTDAVIREIDGLIYILNRFGGGSVDNVTIVDPATNQLVTQISTGDMTNPQDIAVKGDKLYIAALGTANLIVLDVSNPSAEPVNVDLSSFDDSGDGNPDAASVAIVGDTAYVALEHLEFLSQFEVVSRGGSVVMIDTTNDTAIGEIELTNFNPFGHFARAGDDLLIATVNNLPAFGSKDAFTGCVERITTAGTPAAAGCVIDAAAMGGYASDVEVDGDTMWLAVTTSTSFDAAKVVSASLEGTVISEMFTTAGQQPVDLAVCPTGQVVMTDATFGAGGYRVYAADGTELTQAPLDIGQPPSFQNAVICR